MIMARWPCFSKPGAYICITSNISSHVQKSEKNQLIITANVEYKREISTLSCQQFENAVRVAEKFNPTILVALAKFKILGTNSGYYSFPKILVSRARLKSFGASLCLKLLNAHNLKEQMESEGFIKSASYAKL